MEAHHRKKTQLAINAVSPEIGGYALVDISLRFSLRFYVHLTRVRLAPWEQTAWGRGVNRLRPGRHFGTCP